MICARCGVDKDPHEFADYPRLKGGKSPWCMACAEFLAEHRTPVLQRQWRRAYMRMYLHEYRGTGARTVRWWVKGIGMVCLQQRTGTILVEFARSKLHSIFAWMKATFRAEEASMVHLRLAGTKYRATCKLDVRKARRVLIGLEDDGQASPLPWIGWENVKGR